MSEVSWWWDGESWRLVGVHQSRRSRQGTGRAVVACVLILVTACLFAGGLAAFTPYYRAHDCGIVLPAGPTDVVVGASLGFT